MPITTFFFCLLLLGLAQSIIRHMQLNLTYLRTSRLRRSIDRSLLTFQSCPPIGAHFEKWTFLLIDHFLLHYALIQKISKNISKKRDTNVSSTFYRNVTAYFVWLRLSWACLQLAFDSIIAEENGINWKKSIKRIIVFLKCIVFNWRCVSSLRAQSASLQCF